MKTDHQTVNSANIGICKLCSEERELCRSHAIPKAHFRQILRRSPGGAVAISSDESSPIRYTQDSWHARFLCTACEHSLNNSYDEYGISVLRDDSDRAKRSTVGITFTHIDRIRLRMFCLSILWRISVSKNVNYSNIDLPFLWEMELHEALKGNEKLSSSRFPVCIYKLRNQSGVLGFDNAGLRSASMAPEAFAVDGFQTVYFLCFGFLIEIVLPCLPKKYSARIGLLSGTKNIFLAPYREVCDFKPLMDLSAHGIRKHALGLTTVR